MLSQNLICLGCSDTHFFSCGLKSRQRAQSEAEALFSFLIGYGTPAHGRWVGDESPDRNASCKNGVHGIRCIHAYESIQHRGNRMLCGLSRQSNLANGREAPAGRQHIQQPAIPYPKSCVILTLHPEAHLQRLFLFGVQDHALPCICAHRQHANPKPSRALPPTRRVDHARLCAPAPATIARRARSHDPSHTHSSATASPRAIAAPRALTRRPSVLARRAPPRGTRRCRWRACHAGWPRPSATAGGRAAAASGSAASRSAWTTSARRYYCIHNQCLFIDIVASITGAC